MGDRKSETAAVKAALKAAGVDVLAVKHGRGTTHGWLYVTLAWGSERDSAIGIIAKASGRSVYGMEQVGIRWGGEEKGGAA